MSGDLNPAIQFLDGKWEEAQCKADELLGALNVRKRCSKVTAFEEKHEESGI